MALPLELREAWDQAREDLVREIDSDRYKTNRASIDEAVNVEPGTREDRRAKLLEIARTRVPRYASFRNRDNLTLSDFPLTTKRDLQQFFAESIARAPGDGAMDAGSFFLVCTSGSTGEPVSTLKTAESDGFADAVIKERMYRALGLSSTGTSLSLPLLQAGTPLIEAVLLPRPYVNWNLRGYDPNSADVRAEYDAIVGHFDVDYIYGTSSRVIALALFCRANGITLSPKSIVVSYEHLPESGRALIEETFGCTATSMYGTTETGLAGWECGHRNMHFQDDWVDAEILDDQNERVTDGTHGNVVLTSFKTRVMPIIRYVTGDMAASPIAICPCGEPGTVTPGLSGRSQARLIGVDGAIYSPYPLLAALSAAGLPDFQVSQETAGELQLCTSSYGPKPHHAVESINERLADFFGHGSGFRLTVGGKDDFELTALGKRNPVVQRLEIPMGSERTGYLTS